MSDPALSSPAPALTSARPPYARVLLLGMLLLAFALRLLHLGSQSLWYDETVSVYLARQSIPQLLAHTAGDIHPPGYYLLLHGWQWLVRPTPAHGLEFLFAWPSLCCGLLVVALLYPLGRRLFDPTTALLAVGLAASYPFQIWYSQEVRMYTLGATLGLGAFWALLNYFAIGVGQRHQTSRGRRRWLVVYTLCATLGLYSLYYFLFLLITLNLLALGWLHEPGQEWPRRAMRQSALSGRSARRWWGAQVAILILWAPWLPIFWRQATDPPVPPWRLPWDSMQALGSALSESISALIAGQSSPWPTHWLWLVVGVTGLVFLIVNSWQQPALRRGLVVTVLYALLPWLMIFTISLMITPLYHVRYLSLYAPPLLLPLAYLVQTVRRHWQPLGWLLLLAIMLLDGWSLWRFWHAPAFQRDDHRAAVTELAQAWRPGDLILVNAGWVYTALAVYWPTDLVGADAALPPPLSEMPRLHDYAQSVTHTPPPLTTPLLIRGGSVDGAPDLGWNDPDSDFFALDATTTTSALQTLRQQAARLWHYRQYDTVSDPAGVIRAWLATNGLLLRDTPIPGRDFLRLQLYDFAKAPPTASPLPAGNAIFAVNGWQLRNTQPVRDRVAAGHTLYVQTTWQPQSTGQPPPTLSVSLRLVDEAGNRFAQQDEQASPAQWQAQGATLWTLALPVAVATPPGPYQLQAVFYAPDTGAIFYDTLAQGAAALITVTTAPTAPTLAVPLARFDYLALQTLRVGLTTVERGATLPVEAIWLPRPNAYQDTYLARWQLLDDSGAVQQQWELPLGSWAYPSAVWPADIPVRQPMALRIGPTLAPGTYQLALAVIRNGDGNPLPPIVPWQQRLWGEQRVTATGAMVRLTPVTVE